MNTLMIGIRKSAEKVPDGNSPNTMKIPLDALKLDGVEPEMGDPLDMQISGEVTRLDGRDAIVTVKSVNGVHIEDPAEDKADNGTDEDREEKAMRDLATKADQHQLPS